MISLQGCRLIAADVWHKRHQPGNNQFRYAALYFASPLSHLKEFNGGLLRGYGRPALISIQDRDYGSRGRQDNFDWVRTLLNPDIAGQLTPSSVVLVAMPRVLGFQFNPIVLWMCYGAEGALLAAIVEVNNTFGETHHYICEAPGNRSLSESTSIQAEKEFHVSPFYQRCGHYNFSFSLDSERLDLVILYRDDTANKLLSTSLTGKLVMPGSRGGYRALLRAPLVSILSLLQIYRQAVRLKRAGIPWINKPSPMDPAVTHAVVSTSPKGKI